MASKATLVNGEERQAPARRQGANSKPNMFDKVAGVWHDFTRFLSDVRAEMRKVVAPSRKEVEVTTWVVLVSVFLFGLFFFIVDTIFSFGIDHLLQRLGGTQ
jgi:preprotein translocase subunit SecE